MYENECAILFIKAVTLVKLKSKKSAYSFCSVLDPL